MRTNLIDMKIRSMNINILVIEKNLGQVFSVCDKCLKGNLMNYLDGASSKCA